MGDEARILPEGYYLDNFFLILNSARDRYKDLLSDDEKGFIDAFEALSISSQRLYVRLVSRKGPYFRTDTLYYPEIEPIDCAIDGLTDAEFAEINGDYDIEPALNLLKVGELRTVFDTVPRQGRKADCVSHIIENLECTDIKRSVEETISVLTPLKSEIVATLLLLFFGNSRQNLSEFVISDLGVVVYEKYPLDPACRPFQSRKAVEAMLSYYDASERAFEMTESHDATGLIALAESIVPVEFPSQLQYRKDRLLNTIARQLEREMDIESAYRFYEASTYPPSRERRARILASTEQLEACADILAEIMRSPLSEDEYEFAAGFSRRCFRKFGTPFDDVQVPSVDIAQSQESVLRVRDAPVEELTAEHLASKGYKTFWCENALINGLFGIIFWDIIFLPLDGVFYNEFQRGPSDLMLPDFRIKRNEHIKRRLKEMEEDDSWRLDAKELYRKKFGVGNAFINWRRLPEDLVTLALDRIPYNHLTGIFDPMSRDIRANTSGFPDLAVFPDDGGLGDYRFIEVKGPGDKVQKNQMRWMKRFVELGVPCEVMWISYL